MKLKITKESKGQSLHLKLSGPIDEDFAWTDLQLNIGKELVVDLDTVELINSCGCREWTKWMKSISPEVSIVLENCPKIFIDQANLIGGFIPKNANIKSFVVPYFCESCEKMTNKLFHTRDLTNGVKDIPGSLVCEKCGNSAEIDVIQTNYFKFLNKPK